jgi:regulator of RNase E activity RraA
MNRIRNVPEVLPDEFRELDTCSVSDALDRLGIACAFLGLRPVIQGSKICGPAFTVHYAPCGVVKGTVGDFLDDVEPGEVVVIDNGGRLHCTVWGGLMSVSAGKRGLGGTVIDGVCRDVPTIYEMNYPIFTKGMYMSTGKDRVEVDGVNAPISVSGVRVGPGDIILGDDSGVIVIPMESAEDVLKIAKEISNKEREIMEAIKEGKSLKDARASVGYHRLQTRR